MRPDSPTPDLLGAVLAGGRSVRFGSDKAFSEIEGRSLVRRAVLTLSVVAARVVVIANDTRRHGGADVPVQPDRVQGLGPLGGVHAAVTRAAEEDLRGVIVLATDMPLVPAGLLRDLGDRVEKDIVVVPASGGPRGFEPLCAAYGVGCRPGIERAIERGDRAVVSFFDDVEVRIVPLDEVSRHGDPDVMFFNVNRPEDHLRATELLAAVDAVERTPERDPESEEDEGE